MKNETLRATLNGSLAIAIVLAACYWGAVVTLDSNCNVDWFARFHIAPITFSFVAFMATFIGSLDN